VCVARNFAALLAVLAVIGGGAAWAQGSLRLPPMPEAKPAETKPAPAPSTATPADRTAQVKAIQLLLHELGLYDNTTNGTLGPATRAAIREFQRSNGDPETGEPSDKLLEDLQKKKPR
jgi:peptidoglycan hydrolase-like protein with peptidoglycan-binding domain